MDSELLQGFLAQAEDFLPTIRSGILVCTRKGNIYGELNTSLRQTASIKDAASIVCLDDAAKVAGELEENLKAVASLKIRLSDEQSRGLLDKLTKLEAILAKARFNTDEFSDHLTDFVDQSFENLGLREPNAETVEKSEVIEETDGWEEEFEIDEEMLGIFSEEAEELIGSISANLKILEKTPSDREALLEIRRNAHTLKGSAGIVGLKTLSEVAHRVEDLLDYLAENEIEAGEKIFEMLRVAADCFSALASGENTPQLAKKINHLYESFDAAATTLQTKEKAGEAAVEIVKPEKTADQVLTAAVVAPPDSAAASFAVSENPFNNRSVVRISLEKLDDLVKLVSGLVISRSVFEQRLAELEQQIGELHNSTRRLQQSTNKLETNFEADMLEGGSRLSAASSQQLLNPKSKIQNPKSFDALELDHFTEFHQTMRVLIETTGDTSAINGALGNLKNNLESLFENQHHLIEEMQDKLLRLRMVSFGSLAVRLQRTVRVTADEEGKSAELIIEGEDLEIDTQILDSLIEPLLHLLRNAVAHGIELPETRRLLGKPETGQIKVSISDEGTHFILNVSDDGRGISVAALKDKAVQSGIIGKAAADAMSEQEAFALIFLVGLTTAEEVSQVSGRGVGMNIVKTAVARQQGVISIDSEIHQGTTFTVRLPMQMSVTRALLVKAGERIFALPLRLIKHISRLSADGNLWSGGENQPSKQSESAKRNARGERTGKKLYSKNKIPESSFFYLNDLLGFSSNGAAPKSENAAILLLETADSQCGLIVDEIIKSEEIIIKPLGNPLHDLPELLGATILGDGGVVPVLNLIYLLESEAKSQQSEVKSQKELSANKKRRPKTENRKSLKILIVDDSPSVRHLNSNIIKNAGWTAIVAKDGLEALNILQDSRELPDIILSDVEMPRMNGYELLASLKKQEQTRAIPVVMITSRASEKHRRKAFDLGVSEFLTKPFDDAKLIEIIKSLTVLSN